MSRVAALVVAALVASGLLLGGCASPRISSAPVGSVTPSQLPTGNPSARPTPDASIDRVAGWRSDIEHLLAPIERLHPDLYARVPKAALEAELDRLHADVPRLADDEVMVDLVRIVSSISASGRDAHTGIYPWSPESRYPLGSLPLRLWLFPDGVRVVDALPPYESLVGSRVEGIGGLAVADLVRAIDPLVPRDNGQTVRALMPRFLLIPEILHGLGLIDAVGPIDLAVVNGEGRRSTVSVQAIPIADYNAWSGPYGLFLPPDPRVLYLSRMDEPLWWKRLRDGTLFVQYNRVEVLRQAMVDELEAALRSPGVERVVVDLRHNFGGEVRALEPILAALDDPVVDRPGRFFVITGRNTFSAAVLFAARLQERTRVRIVGEAAGGSPNSWGNARAFTLDYSGLSVAVATTFEVGADREDARLTLEPDVRVPLTFEDWSRGRDPALGAIAVR